MARSHAKHGRWKTNARVCATVTLRREWMNTRNLMNSKCLLSAAVSAALLASVPAVADDSVRSFEIYGFAQADYIQDIGGRLDPDWDDAFRPSKICFDGACGEDGQASISVKQSRFGVKGTMPTGSTTARRSASSSSSTCSAPAWMRARPPCACATSTASGGRSSPARPTASSWTSTCSRTRSTTGVRRAWCSIATCRSAGRRTGRRTATSPSPSNAPATISTPATCV